MISSHFSESIALIVEGKSDEVGKCVNVLTFLTILVFMSQWQQISI